MNERHLSPRPENDSSSPSEVRDELGRLTATSHAIARKVLPFLGARGIPVTPTNYRLWYAYFSDGSPELKEALERMLQEQTRFTPEVTQATYQRFFSLEATELQVRAIDQAGEKIQGLAVSLIRNILVSIAQTGEFNQRLGDHIERLEKAEDLSAIQEVIARIIEESGQVLRGQESLKRQMEQSSRALDRLQSELQRRDELARTDELTGLANRRAFNDRVREEANRAKRYRIPVALVIMDLDDFKKVNDTFGHQVGDRLLSTMAKALAQSVRDTDLAARYGGEEFAVICPHTDLNGALIMADRLRELVCRTEFTVRGRQIAVTISAGVSAIVPGEPSEDWIERADRALYLAKRKGKNRVCTEQDLTGHGDQTSDLG